MTKTHDTVLIHDADAIDLWRYRLKTIEVIIELDRFERPRNVLVLVKKSAGLKGNIDFIEQVAGVLGQELNDIVRRNLGSFEMTLLFKIKSKCGKTGDKQNHDHRAS
ncbi:hypothetical protein [Dechloromonas denitrificans]|uniref:hypothetical protein n=1 Tax=Dechloromonas denitrificans TaxID=281362 RepID=UPI00299F0D2C|nr:hypothetical protein [Dechloromonas denitrificans]